MNTLTQGSMMGSHWNPLGCENSIALKGSGMVRVLTSSISSSSLECKKARFTVPRLHPKAQFSFSSALRMLDREVLEASFNVKKGDHSNTPQPQPAPKPGKPEKPKPKPKNQPQPQPQQPPQSFQVPTTRPQPTKEPKSRGDERKIEEEEEENKEAVERMRREEEEEKKMWPPQPIATVGK